MVLRPRRELYVARRTLRGTEGAVTVPDSAAVVDSTAAPRVDADVPDAQRKSQDTAVGEKRSASHLAHARKQQAVESAHTGSGVEINMQPREVVMDARNEEKPCEAGGVGRR